ncbi:hypothetical protein MMC28_010618 [Mycoblastus sanguinarius]|nr:hypothetical protein [Mycoblastus sanguinarius]
MARPRVCRSGAITKPSSSKSKAIAKSVTNRVIDSTGESDNGSGEASEEDSGGNSSDEGDVENTGEEEEEESEDMPAADSDFERADGWVQRQPRRSEHQHRGPRAMTQANQAMNDGHTARTQYQPPNSTPEYVLEDSFIDTSTHHRHWHRVDDQRTLGAHMSEKDAMVAAQEHYESWRSYQGDGWEWK